MVKDEISLRVIYEIDEPTYETVNAGLTLNNYTKCLKVASNITVEPVFLPLIWRFTETNLGVRFR